MSHWRTGRIASGDNRDPASTSARGAHAEPNLLAGDPPRRFNLTVIRGGSFLEHDERKQVQEPDAVFDHREFAALVFVSACAVSIGVLLAIGVALLDWS